MAVNECPCEKAFKIGQRARRAYQLPYGRYKLEETRRRLNQDLKTLCDIMTKKGAGRIGRARREHLPLPDDAAFWLKKLPEIIARDLGYYIIPAIEALGGDGLPRREVEKRCQSARVRAAEIVSRCDDVRGRLRRGGINLEYTLMKNGNSLLKPLLLDTVALVQEQLDLTDETRSAG